MRAKFLASLFIMAFIVICGGEGVHEVGEGCAEYFQKATTCLTYATGKAATPTKDCCNAVADIKESRPECLCYLLLQMHNATNYAQIKSMGIQEARLLHLPSACKLTNASISDCPKLLHIPPNSSDYAIFTNSSASTTVTAPTGTSSPEATDGSDGLKHGPQLARSIAIAVTVLFYEFPAGLASTFYT